MLVRDTREVATADEIHEAFEVNFKGIQ